MDYNPLANRYRPKTFQELIGQEVLVKTLTNAIKLGKTHHAYLFVGHYGTGKTSAARVFAAALNCLEKDKGEPCGKCKNCVDIFEGKSPDVVEMDAASNRGIDDIREIRKEANYCPVSSKYKIFIIDESHALSKDAVEALLKILEEPPSAVKFVLCTTEKHKIKPTILTRCQDFYFEKISIQTIHAHIKYICEQEKVNIDQDALRIISKYSQGHLRDALKALDKIILYSGDEPIAKSAATKCLGAVDEELAYNLVDSVIKKDFAEGVKTIQKMMTISGDVQVATGTVIDHLRNLLVVSACSDTSGIMEVSEEEKKRLVHQRSQIKLEVVSDMIGYLVDIHKGILYNVNCQVLFERFLLESIRSHFVNSQT